mmetsp:Transcript_14293/g.39403  ORF Transcript_14293/g.39403 Transcript_14293/m.39403 type:complete len:81 (+) Transcript_14293:119-361(+)
MELFSATPINAAQDTTNRRNGKNLFMLALVGAVAVVNLVASSRQIKSLGYLSNVESEYWDVDTAVNSSIVDSPRWPSNIT